MKKIKKIIKNFYNIFTTDNQDRLFYKDTLSKPIFYTSKNLYFHHMVGTGGNSFANVIANYYKPENFFQITEGAILNKSIRFNSPCSNNLPFPLSKVLYLLASISGI